MPVTLSWFDEAHTILLQTGQRITAAELTEAKPELSRLQQSVPHPIGIIQDMRNMSLVDPTEPSRSRPTSMIGMTAVGSIPDSSGRVVALAFVYQADMVDSMNQMYSQMLALFARNLPEESRIPVRAFASVGAAADFITDVLNQRKSSRLDGTPDEQ